MSGVSGALNLRRWQAKPRRSSEFWSTSSAPASAGVMLGQRIRSRVSSTGSISMATWVSVRSIPQQLVDRGLGPGLLVDPLDDDGAIEARPRAAVRQRLAGKRA